MSGVGLKKKTSITLECYRLPRAPGAWPGAGGGALHAHGSACERAGPRASPDARALRGAAGLCQRQSLVN